MGGAHFHPGTRAPRVAGADLRVASSGVHGQSSPATAEPLAPSLLKLLQPKVLEAFTAPSEPCTVENVITKAPGFMDWSNRETTCLCLPSTLLPKKL